MTATNSDVCEVCDTLFYNGPINEWISINAENLAIDLDCEDIELNISSSNNYQIVMNSNVNETEGGEQRSQDLSNFLNDVHC